MKVGGDQVVLVPRLSIFGGDASHGYHRVVAPMIEWSLLVQITGAALSRTALNEMSTSIHKTQFSTVCGDISWMKNKHVYNVNNSTTVISRDFHNYFVNVIKFFNIAIEKV